MKISTFVFTFKQGFKNIFRNKLFSLATIATIAACIFLFGVFYSLVVNVQYSIAKAETNVAVTVFFNEDISEGQIQQIGEMIRGRSEVASVEYVSASDAWESFKVDYLGEYADGYEGDNPLEGSENYEIYLKDVSKQPELVAWLETVDGVREINHSDVTANILTQFNKMLSYVSLGIIGILLAVSLFLISNTVSMGIAVRREEIGIMKLIGATNFVVRFPFLIEGVLLGLIGAGIPLAAVYYMYNYITGYAEDHFVILNDLLQFQSPREIFSVLIPVAMVLGVGLGFFGSFISVKRHLRV
ncbi:MAG: permease-like cell division protein FtsX [Lachnospiraceae bacterium]|nr:permease-like cell division protein FtsX [Lachnospiraceae bacterium]